MILLQVLVHGDEVGGSFISFLNRLWHLLALFNVWEKWRRKDIPLCLLLIHLLFCWVGFLLLNDALKSVFCVGLCLHWFEYCFFGLDEAYWDVKINAGDIFFLLFIFLFSHFFFFCALLEWTRGSILNWWKKFHILKVGNFCYIS